jgi:exodeoxyribonuclease VII small subunit
LHPTTRPTTIRREANLAIRRATATAETTKSTTGPRAGAPSFEDSIRRLSEIVEALEGGELPLEESLALFEEGVKLARTSQATLDAAEKRVEELLSVDEEGNPVVRELDVG